MADSPETPEMEGPTGSAVSELLDEEVLEKLRQRGVQLVTPEEIGLAPRPMPGPAIPIPWLLSASGLYEWKWSLQPIPLPQPTPIPIQPLPIRPMPRPGLEEDGVVGEAPTEADERAMAERAFLPPWWFQREELRLDVDGRYPLMKASGTIYSGLSMRVHWIADLTPTGPNSYAGTIWYKDGNTAWLPHTNVSVTVFKSWFPGSRRATVRFTGSGIATRVRTYRWRSPYAHPVDFEYDTVKGTTAITQISTGDHPNRPASLPVETLSIDTVFRRAGFQVTSSAGTVPISAAGANAKWSDMEMHDAMQVYWSRFANKPQWAMWVLFASLHDRGTSLGGIMFDDIGPNHRQGTSVFNDSFIKNAPPGDLNPAAWVKRMKFWTACHEMGHSFNLAHSWQKALGTPWIPLVNQPEVRSFMNYPFRVAGGERTFFSDFEFRFSDDELLFMRHAPERFVQMGNADWFDHHGFQQANVSPASPYALELRAHRDIKHFEFMEPVVVELKLSNRSSQPLIVDNALLKKADDLTVIIKKRGAPARQWRPLAQYCHHADAEVLQPGKALYEPLQIATGIGGWEISEPGIYTIQVALHLDDEDVISNELTVRVAPPRSYEEEYVAQDFFSEDVSRVLAFNGSRYFEGANDTLREVVDQFGERRVANHARLALANPLTRDYKLLAFEDGRAAVTGEEKGRFKVVGAKLDDAREPMKEALLEAPKVAAETFGHIPYRQLVEQYSTALADEGDPVAAATCIEEAKKALASRKVLDQVIDEMEKEQKQLAARKATKARATKSKATKAKNGRRTRKKK